MRRIAIFLLSVLLIALLAVPVYAEMQIDQANMVAIVDSDGETCQINLTATLHVEQLDGDITFPVPLDARSIKLNGKRVRTEKSDVARLIDLGNLTGKIVGDITFNVSYSVKNVVEHTPTGPQVAVPMLSGFAYPIEEFEFSVTLPGEISAKPAFSSGYHQSNIEKDLTWEVNGPTVTGQSLTALKDHETLTFTVSVPQEMFPSKGQVAPDLTFSYIAMGVCAGAALLFWLVSMRCLPPRRMLESAPPDGYSAGELKSLLTLTGADLTMMVFSWAQMGYVLIRAERGGRVVLHKRMDMGNERGGYERRCFHNLFRKSPVVDTSTRQYALLQKKVASTPGDWETLVHKRTGSPKIFRVLAVLTMMFCGVCVGIAMSEGAALQWLLAIVLAIAGLASGWYMQESAFSLFAMDKRPLRNTAIICGVWLLLGLLAGQFNVVILCCISQILAGLMVAFGGRRTQEGRQLMAQVLGLNRYLRKLSRTDLERITRDNPEYFHNIAPYALALGADRLLARNMGKLPLPACSYLATGNDESMTASQWSNLMRRTAFRMEARAKKMPQERFWQIVRSIRV